MRHIPVFFFRPTRWPSDEAAVCSASREEQKQAEDPGKNERVFRTVA